MSFLDGLSGILRRHNQATPDVNRASWPPFSRLGLARDVLHLAPMANPRPTRNLPRINPSVGGGALSARIDARKIVPLSAQFSARPRSWGSQC